MSALSERWAAAPALPPTVRPAGSPAPSPAPPRLQVVRAPAHRRTRAPFVLTCIAVLVVAMVATLLLNVAMAQGEYDRHALQTRYARSVQEQERLGAELEWAASPATLAAAATSLGMVRSTGGGFLRLADGVVLGSAVPAPVPEVVEAPVEPVDAPVEATGVDG